MDLIKFSKVFKVGDYAYYLAKAADKYMIFGKDTASTNSRTSYFFPEDYEATIKANSAFGSLTDLDEILKNVGVLLKEENSWTSNNETVVEQINNC